MNGFDSTFYTVLNEIEFFLYLLLVLICMLFHKQIVIVVLLLIEMFLGRLFFELWREGVKRPSKTRSFKRMLVARGIEGVHKLLLHVLNTNLKTKINLNQNKSHYETSLSFSPTFSFNTMSGYFRLATTIVPACQ